MTSLTPKQRRLAAPTCDTRFKQVTDDCPVCGPKGPCPDGLKPSRETRPILAAATLAVGLILWGLISC